MSPEEIVLVETSFDQILLVRDAFAEQFYGRLFAADPTLRDLFADDMAGQREKLMTMLSAAIHGLWQFEDLVPVLRRLGAAHVQYGVLPGHYAVVGGALLATLEDVLGDTWTPHLAAAWAAVFSQVTSEMLSGDATKRSPEGAAA